MRLSPALRAPLTNRAVTGAAMRRAANPHAWHSRALFTLKDHVYFSKATAEGPGRSGLVTSNGDAPLQLKMAMPKTTGGKGDGQNPEQLFAMGYASCFLGALQLAAARAQKKELADAAKVHVSVFLGHPSDPDIDGFGLRADVCVENFDDDAVIAAAHEFCPYSRALKHGAAVNVHKA